MHTHARAHARTLMHMHAHEGHCNTCKHFVQWLSLPRAQLELTEVIDFFRKPERFKDSGARVPKGVLLIGCDGVDIKGLS